MNSVLLDKIKKQKQLLLEEDGFEIVAIFGSFAKGLEKKDSDIDLLYDIKPKFLKKYGGFQAFDRLNKIRENLQNYLGRDIDLATIDNHSKTFKQYALKDIIYV